MKQKKQRKQTVRMLISIDQRYRDVLNTVRARDGVALKHQFEQAITLWAKSRGMDIEDVR